MNPAEIRGLTPARRRRDRELNSLADALCDLMPASDQDIRDGVRAEWGDATDADIDRVLNRLLRDGVVGVKGGLYVRREQ